MRAPTVKSEFGTMPQEPAARKEAAVELCGQHLFSLRNQRLDALRHIIETKEVRERLGALHRKEYEAVAALEPEARQAALGLARKAIDLYMQDLLGLLTNIGTSLAFGPNHAINYKLTLQVKEAESNEVIEEFIINRGGERVFYENYGRWLNRYGDHR
jgi:hypothetical protein